MTQLPGNTDPLIEKLDLSDYCPIMFVDAFNGVILQGDVDILFDRLQQSVKKHKPPPDECFTSADVQEFLRIDHEYVLYTAYTYDWSPTLGLIDKILQIAKIVHQPSHFFNLWISPITQDRRILFGKPSVTERFVPSSLSTPGILNFSSLGVPFDGCFATKRATRFYNYLLHLRSTPEYLKKCLAYESSSLGAYEFQHHFGDVVYSIKSHFQAICCALIYKSLVSLKISLASRRAKRGSSAHISTSSSKLPARLH